MVPQDSCVRWYSAAVGFALLTAVAMAWLDEPVARLGESAWPGDVRRLVGWSEAYAHGLGIVLIALAIGWLDRQRRPFVPRLLLVVWAVGLAANVLKLLVARHRPYACLNGGLPLAASFVGFPGDPGDATQQSFPSGHTASAVALAIVLCRLYPRGKLLFIALALLAGAQRIVAQAHFLSDTLAAAGLACLIAGPLVCRYFWDAVGLQGTLGES